MCKYVIKKMLKKKYGKIINITSVVGHTGNLVNQIIPHPKLESLVFQKAWLLNMVVKI